MIVFDLQCKNGHRFEEWFASSVDYEARRGAGQIRCGECGESEVDKALMAPRINSGASAPAAPCGLPACAGGTCQFGGTG
jgi:hypothetical protein